MKNTKKTRVWIRTEVLDALQTEARRRGVSLNDLLRQEIAKMKKAQTKGDK